MKKITDILLLIVFCALAGTGLGMEFLGKSGGEIHTILGIAMIVLVVIHIALNRKWFVEVLCKGNVRGAAAVFFLGVLILVISMIALPDRGKGHRHQHKGPPAAGAGIQPHP